MDLIKNIRNLYTPLQPTIRRKENEVSYVEHWPNKELQPYIYCYWELSTKERLIQPFNYRVVSDGCIDIFFDLNKTEESFVMGFCKKYTEFPLENHFHYVGIRFLPTIFPQIFKINAGDLSDKFQSLQDVNSTCSEFITREISPDMTSDSIVKTLDEYFLELVKPSDFDDDGRLYEALDVILARHGMVNIDSDINTGISHRQLRRIFKYYVGATPKVFSKVVRFQNIVRAKPSKQSLRQNKLFYDLGYFDQAHFIKDFRNFYGVTPSKAFGRE